jgi:hypothetical protein
VQAIIREQMQAAGCSYLVAQFAFGDMSFDEAQRSVDLFARAVMPALKDV